jgi:copper chaperone CopZ
MHELDGIHSVRADFESKSVVVLYDDQYITLKEIIDKINSLGYQAGMKENEI